MNKFELVVLKAPKSGGDKAKALYATALDCLDEFLDVVELPPTESGHYDKEFSTNVGESSRITWVVWRDDPVGVYIVLDHGKLNLN